MLLRSLVGLKDGRLSLEDGSTGGLEELHEIDTVIAARLNAAWNPLEAELSAAGVPFRLVGDCLSPRTAVEAVYEGHAAGRLM
jgi:hypothetical protein